MPRYIVLGAWGGEPAAFVTVDFVAALKEAADLDRPRVFEATELFTDPGTLTAALAPFRADDYEDDDDDA